MSFASIPKAKTSERGYGAEHQRKRAQNLPLAYGTPCVRSGVDPLCPGLMLEGQALHYDHNDTRDGYLGFAHADCNRRAGARKGSQRSRGLAPASTMPTSRVW